MTAYLVSSRMYLTIFFALVNVPLVWNQIVGGVPCDDPKALILQCFDEQTNEITKGGTIKKNQRVLVKVKIKEGACKNVVPKFSVVFIPPATTDDTDANVKSGLKFEALDFEIEPYTIETTGPVSLKVYLTNFGTSIADPETCDFTVEFAKPEVTLPGGSEQYYPANQKTEIASQAKNPNNKDGGQEGLTFKWNCAVEEGTVSNFCNAANMNTFDDKNTLVIPAGEAKKENVFSITLDVGLQVDSNYVTTVKQKVFYTRRDFVAKLEVRCIKNCIPKAETTLPLMPTILQAVCENCGLTDSNYLYWTIKDSEGHESVDYTQLKNRKGEQFYLKAGSLQENAKYEVEVEVIIPGGGGMTAEFNLHTKLPPPVKHCNISPASGVAFLTGFQVMCAFFPGNLVFELFAIKNGKSNLITKTTNIEEVFMLPAGVSVLLNCTDQKTGHTQSIVLNVQVTECLNLVPNQTDEEINRMVDDKFGDVMDYAKEGSSEMALQGIAAVVSEYSNLPAEKQDMARDLDKKAISVIKQIQLDSAEKAQQAVDIIAQISDRYNESDPEVSAQATEMCTKASKVLLKHAKEAKNPELMRTQITNSMKALARCSQSGLKENVKSVESLKVIVVMSTTEFPLIPVHNPQEDYPDYTDDEKSADNMAQACVTHKNPYWYMDNIPLISPVVYAHFIGRMSEQSTLDVDLAEDGQNLDQKDFFQMKLVTDDDITLQQETHQAPLPDQSISETNEAFFFQKISTHRIFVFKNLGFTINFLNLTATDNYHVTVTHFEKPNFEYFKANRQLITRANSIVDIIETRPYDSFWYLSVLPGGKMKSPENYNFNVSTTGCYTWNDTSRRWEVACNSAVGILVSRNITCHCKSGYIFTGYVRSNKANLVENFVADFALELNFCWIVYAVTIGTYFLFGLFLFITSFERRDDILDRVFFVGDVPSFHQYAYVVIIKTGKIRRSGTTSNVTIKLCGSEGDSLEHILNYPDPELVMLQRDTETWFVLATGKQLGDLKTIEIWFDSIGHNTKWYCSKIDVYDIQTDRSWPFHIEEWFNVTQEEHSKFILTPTQTELIVKDDQNNCKRVLHAIKSFLGKIEHQVNLWNVLVADPLLSRKERVSFIFSSLLLMYSIIMLTYSVPIFDESDTIDEHSFGYQRELIWTPIAGSVAAFLVHFPLIYVVKRGKIRSLKSKRIQVISNICWLMVILISMTAITLLIICGFWIPINTSLLWLVSIVLGFVFDILVLQNISRIIYYHIIHPPTEIKPFELTIKRIIQYVELQRAWIYKRFGTFSLRPHLKHLYYSLDYITIRERFRWEETKRKVKEILDDLVMITLYVTFLYIVLMLDKEPQAVYNHNEVKKLILDEKMSIQSFYGIEDFISNELLPSVQAIQWYGKFIQTSPGMMKDFSNTYLGIIRLRQHRTQEIKCEHPEALRFLNMSCRPDFNVLKESGNFSRGWVPPADISNITTERMAQVWRYSGSNVTGASPYFGEFGFYPGGGYVAPLGRNLKNSLINMNYLKKHKWLDMRTRAVFIEFLTYNPNVNLFNSVKLAFEISAAGHIAHNLQIQTRKFLVIDRDRILTKNTISVCFALAIFALVARIVYKLVKKRRRYFYDLWSIFDILIVLLSALSIFLYYERLGRMYVYISNITVAKNNEFVNYFHLFVSDNTLSALTALLVFAATLRLWKLLRFMKIVKTAEKTLNDSWLPLLVCIIYQMLYLVAFSLVGFLFFSTVSNHFRNFNKSFISLLLLGLGLFDDFEADFLTEHPLGVAFYTMYMLFSLFFLTVYIAIISLYYADAKDYFADEPSFVQKYVREKWTYYKTLLAVKAKKLRGGSDDIDKELIIKPKSGERYEDCFTIPRSRLDTMALITVCVLINQERKKMTEKDFELMSKTIKSLFGKESSEKELFFTCGDSHHIQFVDNRHLSQIASHCERFMRECKEIHRVSRQEHKSLIDERTERINVLIDNVETITSVLNLVQVNFIST